MSNINPENAKLGIAIEFLKEINTFRWIKLKNTNNP